MNVSLRTTAITLVMFLTIRPAFGITELTTLAADDGVSGDSFGETVAVSGNLVVVGASFAQIDMVDVVGAAYVFESDGAGSWGQVAKLIADDGVEFDQFGIAVAIDGDTVVVGAKGAPIGGNSSQGAAYVFRHAAGDTSDWTQIRKLEAEPVSIGNLAEYGTAVDIDGDTIVIGAEKGGTGSTGGYAYVYRQDLGGPDNWGEEKRLVDDRFDNNASFGAAVTIQGDTIAVGAPSLDEFQNSFNNEGGFYVFHRDEGGADNWGQTNRIFASDADGSAFFGRGLDISGNTLAVGSWAWDGATSSEGRIYLFDNASGTPGDWTETVVADADDPVSFAFYGRALSLLNDTVIVGAEGADASNGKAYRHGRDVGGADSWGQDDTLTASDAGSGDLFGFSVAMNGNHIVVGAPGNGAGLVYVYEGPGDTDPDSDGDGVADSIDNCLDASNPAQTDSDADGYGNRCDADLNNDCIVNALDLGILKTVFFGADANADLNADGVVNAIDLGLMKTLFFMPPGPAANGTPCP